MSHSESLDLEIEILCKRLLQRTFGINIGDWIAVDSIADGSKRVQLEISHVDFYLNTLTLSGPVITQKGQVGKRINSIQIRLDGDMKDEY